MVNQTDQTQAGKTVRGKYECVVVKFHEVYIVAYPCDVRDIDLSVEKTLETSLPNSEQSRTLAAKPSFEGDSEPTPILPKYYGYPYIRVGGDDFSDVKQLHDYVRSEIKGLEGKLGEGQKLSLTEIRQHFAQKPEYIVLGNYKPLPSQL